MSGRAHLLLAALSSGASTATLSRAAASTPCAVPGAGTPHHVRQVALVLLDHQVHGHALRLVVEEYVATPGVEVITNPIGLLAELLLADAEYARVHTLADALEDQVIPTVEKVTAAIRTLAAY